ncbi:MAG: hypothetical protein M1504_02665 [Candidatus Marsarchaeota archaeon]|nr:hypothetical protein [Candidatus Marsarchaeota archaeon]
MVDTLPIAILVLVIVIIAFIGINLPQMNKVNANTVVNLNSTPQQGASSQIYLSKSQFESLIGGGGTYNVSSYTGSQIVSALQSSGNLTGIGLANNVSQMWISGYAFGTKSNPDGGVEMVLQLINGQAQIQYGSILNKSKTEAGLTTDTLNAQNNGLTYSAFQGSAGGRMVYILIGYKGDYLVIFYSFVSISSNQLATFMSDDIS